MPFLKLHFDNFAFHL